MKNLLLLFCLCGAANAFAQLGNYPAAEKRAAPPANAANYNSADANFRNQNAYRSAARAGVSSGAYNDVTFTVNALNNAKPDAFTAIFSVIQIGATAKEAEAKFQDRVKPFLTAIQSKGVTTEDVFTDMVSFKPLYEVQTEKKLFSKTYNEIPTGFEVQKNIHIRYRNAALINDIITLAAEQEIYDLIQVQYFVDDSERIRRDLRDRALRFVVDQQAAYRALHVVTDTLVCAISENFNVKDPNEQYTRYQSYTSQAVEAIHAKGAEVKQPQHPATAFYDPASNNNYEIVINPHVSEPVIQYTYTLTAHFYPKPVRPLVVVPPTKVYYIITPQGDVKPFAPN